MEIGYTPCRVYLFPPLPRLHSTQMHMQLYRCSIGSPLKIYINLDAVVKHRVRCSCVVTNRTHLLNLHIRLGTSWTLTERERDTQSYVHVAVWHKFSEIENEKISFFSRCRQHTLDTTVNPWYAKATVPFRLTVATCVCVVELTSVCFNWMRSIASHRLHPKTLFERNRNAHRMENYSV